MTWLLVGVLFGSLLWMYRRWWNRHAAERHWAVLVKRSSGTVGG
jgi:hypothetical protein